MSDDFSPHLSVAMAAVRRAAKVCVATQAGMVSGQVLEKDDRSPVTVADFASQAVVCAALAEAFPSIPLVGEEDAGELRKPSNQVLRASVLEHTQAVWPEASEDDLLRAIDWGNATGQEGLYWTLDPIDGTKGFLRGGHYAIALGLIRDGELLLGVLGCPQLESPGGEGTLLCARKGRGAQAGPLDREAGLAEIHTAEDRPLAQARMCESVEKGHSAHDQAAQIVQHLGIEVEGVRMDSQAKYAAVARGDAEIYLRLPRNADYQEKIWDHAAGVLILQEAGGKVSDIEGKNLDFTHGQTLAQNQGIVATARGIHDEVVAAVHSVLG